MGENILKCLKPPPGKIYVNPCLVLWPIRDIPLWVATWSFCWALSNSQGEVFGISSHFNEMCKTSFTRRWFKVTFSSPSSRSLNCLKGLEELSPHPKTSPFSSSTEVWPSPHATPFTTDLCGISKICADLIWLIWIGTWGFTHDGLAFYRPLVFDAKEFWMHTCFINISKSQNLNDAPRTGYPKKTKMPWLSQPRCNTSSAAGGSFSPRAPLLGCAHWPRFFRPHK